jgi:hypothetical protein
MAVEDARYIKLNERYGGCSMRRVATGDQGPESRGWDVAVVLARLLRVQQQLIPRT